MEITSPWQPCGMKLKKRYERHSANTSSAHRMCQAVSGNPSRPRPAPDAMSVPLWSDRINALIGCHYLYLPRPLYV